MQPANATLMALFLAHLLGDFPFQSHWLAANKDKSYKALLWHGLVHYLLAWLCLAIFAPVAFLSIANQSILVGYVVAHISIDKFKGVLQRRRLLRRDATAFLLDQILHIATLIGTTLLLTRSTPDALLPAAQISTTIKLHILATAIIYVAVVFGGGYLIRFMIRGAEREFPSARSQQLENAGLYIGWIERFLVLTAMAMQSPALVGLILTGKSIARFPEFKEARFAEYFLIGTLLSISLSVLGGILLLLLWYGSVSLK